MEKPFFTVVMPVYGVENHLQAAVDSVLKQTIQDFEIILVDDCSPDGCPEICDQLAATHECIAVIHHTENQGLSGARNTGLQAAKGEYIWFMDSDDVVEEDLLQNVKDSIDQHVAEVVVFGLQEDYYNTHGKKDHAVSICPLETQYLNQQELREAIIDLEMQTLYGYAWNKIYQVEYLRQLGLVYEKVTLIEDILFNVKYCMDIQGMNILAISPYHYMKRIEDGNLTSKFVADYYDLHRRRIQMLYDQYVYWGMCSQEVKQKLGTLYSRYIFSALQRNCDKRANMKHKDRKQFVKEVFQDELFIDTVSYAKPQNTALKIMVRFLKWKAAGLCLMLGRVIYVVKEKLPMLFSKVKQKR